MLVMTATAGFFLAVDSQRNFPWTLFAHSMASIALLAFGVAALNQFLERSTDALMERTAIRPLPSKRIKPLNALLFGLVLSILAEVYLYSFVNTLTALLGLVVIIGYVLIYTPLKRYSTACTAIGAVPGAMPPLMGWTAAGNNEALSILNAAVIFLILLLWQFPHFLAIAVMYKDDYAKAGIKMLPSVELDGKITSFQMVLFSIFLLPITLGPAFTGLVTWWYLIPATVGSAIMLFYSFIAARDFGRESARKLMLASIVYLPTVFLGLVLSKRG